MTVSVSIMAHPRRKAFIPYLHEALGFECPVAWDEGRGIWDTRKRASLLYDPTASHHLVLQDDAILSLNLMAAVEKIVTVVPDSPISLFIRKKARFRHLMRKCKKEDRWLTLGKLCWGVAVLLPVKDIEPMLAFGDTCYLPDEDQRIALYYLTEGKRVYYTLPSLVDHRIDGPSIYYPGDQGHRQAANFIGKGKSGAALNWDGGCVQERSVNYLAKLSEANMKAKG